MCSNKSQHRLGAKVLEAIVCQDVATRYLMSVADISASDIMYMRALIAYDFDRSR